MSFDHEGRRASGVAVGGSPAVGRAPGKQSLTGPLQCKAAEPVARVDNYHGLVHSTATPPSATPAGVGVASGVSFVDSLIGSPVQCAEQSGAAHPDAQAIAADGLSGASTAMPFTDQIQASFGRHSIAGISAHVGGPAADASAALGAHGYATGSSVAFARSPDLHTAAHEAAHVIQQRAGVHLKGGMGEAGDAHERHADAVADTVVRGESAEALLDQYGGSGGGGGVQCSLINPAMPVPGFGSFNINMVTRNAAAPGGNAQLDGFIQFTPAVGSTNSNTIGLWQIVKVTNQGNANSDIPAGTLSPLATPRGALGQPGLVTDNDAAGGVTGGFYSDIHHQSGPAGLRAPGSAASPRNNFEPTPAGGVAAAGQTVGPHGAQGGVFGQTPNGHTPGFKRSDDPADIKSASLYDTPGFSGNADFEFETVARGEDTQVDYGTIKWGFGTRAGVAPAGATTVNEHVSVTGGSSATFGNAIERHRDFYVHEPVVIYFGFDHDDVDAAQDAKLSGLAAYIGRNPAVTMTLDGFADQIGNVAYNVGLSQRRVANVRTALLGHFPAASVVANAVVAGGGHGISTTATDLTSEQPAGTGDQPGGVAAVGADQSREANRQFNRRVTVTFSHPAGTGPAAPGGVGNPAPAAPAAPAGP